MYNKKEIRKSLSQYYFHIPSFLSGVASVLDVGGTFNVFNQVESPEEADHIAIKSDWAIIGKDMEKAFSDFRRHAGL